ncbi:MAG: hypothetical protein Q4F74_04975, partial [Synergistaceae bacterium]|nr:hypothetical protein [Synergistaceae bacterium]
DGEVLWTNIRAIAMQEYSFGKEFFFTLHDITPRVEAEHKYQEELAYRATCLKDCIVHAHCNLSQNLVMCLDTQSEEVYKNQWGKNVDDALSFIIDNIPDGPEKEHIKNLFNRKAMLAAFANGDTTNGGIYFSKLFHRWIRIDYYLLLNPVKECVEAIIFAHDAHEQKLSQMILDVIARKFFDYIGCIDVETGRYNYYFKTDRPIRFPEEKSGDYANFYKEQLRRSVVPEELEDAIVKMDISYIREQLEKNEFYSHLVRIREINGEVLKKRISFTYLDEGHNVIVIARNDADNITLMNLKQRLISNGYLDRIDKKSKK